MLVAGISTDSGLPDYRSPGRPAYRPIQHGDFVGSPAVRQRYWARSTIGKLQSAEELAGAETN